MTHSRHGDILKAYELAARLQLDHAPARLLIFMAAMSVPGLGGEVFLGGRELLAWGLGREVGVDRKADQATYKSVRRCLTVLRSLRLIETVEHSAPGKPAEYRLLLDLERS